ncbi:hypothetical protein SAMN04489860_0596 [Paraoerskovia marina]|uniref:Uncharacterized protein n=1 Tax=Paraoerskovia marina TaxID=545619 RepID=A0A1H1NQN4_9CELL|nr:hypothetical protein [Paraoerskovia marina]SDS01292.1 hypothetical protein SAMN04489860_0596 [Paraoerskovia marina]
MADAHEGPEGDTPSASTDDRWASDVADAIAGKTVAKAEADLPAEKMDRLVQILGRVVDGLDTFDLEAAELDAEARIEADPAR